MSPAVDRIDHARDCVPHAWVKAAAHASCCASPERSEEKRA